MCVIVQNLHESPVFFKKKNNKRNSKDQYEIKLKSVLRLVMDPEGGGLGVGRGSGPPPEKSHKKYWVSRQY